MTLGLHFTALLGGSWVVISWVISRVTIVITHIRGLITHFFPTHEPSSRFRVRGLGSLGLGVYGAQNRVIKEHGGVSIGLRTRSNRASQLRGRVSCLALSCPESPILLN